MSERHIELTWRCSSCQQQNLGRHMVCQGCGNPKDDSEEYEMPVDPSAVASVEDPNLLRMAEAGENWRCAYCDSDQRDLNGECARCGGGRREKERAAAQQQQQQHHAAPRTARRFGIAHAALVAIVSVALIVGACFAFGGRRTPDTSSPPPPAMMVTAAPPARTEFDGTVSGVSWTRTIEVSKWQLADHEGFTSDLPAEALQVRAAGQHVHHHEEVFDHDETVYDEVQVPDGYKTETYTERKSCGEDCTTTPRSCRQVCTRSTRTCRQVCTNKKNGFASCRDECSGGDEKCREECTGGDRKCTTKYCNETRTRQIPKTRTEKRPRVVKKYRSEPRYAAWSAYKTWEWVPSRKETSTGEDVSPSWPDAGMTDASYRELPDGGPRANSERSVETESYVVRIKTDDGKNHVYTAQTEAELSRLAPGTTVKIRIGPGNSVTLL